jgi:hypothetical protein
MWRQDAWHETATSLAELSGLGGSADFQRIAPTTRIGRSESSRFR